MSGTGIARLIVRYPPCAWTACVGTAVVMLMPVLLSVIDYRGQRGHIGDDEDQT